MQYEFSSSDIVQGWGLQKCKIRVALSCGLSISVSFLNVRLKTKY